MERPHESSAQWRELRHVEGRAGLITSQCSSSAFCNLTLSVADRDMHSSLAGPLMPIERRICGLLCRLLEARGKETSPRHHSAGTLASKTPRNAQVGGKLERCCSETQDLPQMMTETMLLVGFKTPLNSPACSCLRTFFCAVGAKMRGSCARRGMKASSAKGSKAGIME